MIICDASHPLHQQNVKRFDILLMWPNLYTLRRITVAEMGRLSYQSTSAAAMARVNPTVTRVVNT